jgi:hypothetical protein
VLLPDRLPSLVVHVGFWIPPALAGWAAARSLEQGAKREPTGGIDALLAAFVLVYAVAWFFFNLHRMPPYIPGAMMDPTVATPKAVAGLALVAGALILPGSALACALAFRHRSKTRQ